MLEIVLLALTLTETPAQATHLLGGESPNVATSAAYRVLQFHGHDDHRDCGGEYTWIFYYDSGGKRLVSVTQNLETAVTPQRMAGAAQVNWKGSHAPGGYPVLLGTLADGRTLVVPGVDSPEKPAQQYQLLRAADLARFYPGLNKEE